MNKQEVIAKAGKIVEKSTAHHSPKGIEPYCTLALIDTNGYPTASTITPAKADGIKWITFCAGLRSNKAKRIGNCNRASVCFNADGAYNITLVGTIEILTDRAVKQEMWYEGLENHFNGVDDPNYCILCFHTQRYNLLVDWQAAKAEGNL